MTTAKKQGSGGASFHKTGVAWWDRKYPQPSRSSANESTGFWMELDSFD
jgi:hypothetical protein